MKKLIVFNWKMAPPNLKEAEDVFKITREGARTTRKGVEIIIAPPFVYLSQFTNLSSGRRIKKNVNLKLGAQNVFWEDPQKGGAFTGEISPSMLKNLGVEYAIIGHSERRRILEETDEIINKKVLTALRAGLKVILCVGESKRKSRDSGMTEVKDYIKKQLQKNLENISKGYKLKNESLIIAYEPIWAIGTGDYCDPATASDMIQFIKHILNSTFHILDSKVLYGGSVNSRNISDFISQPEIDGVLVGGASVEKKELKKIFAVL